MPKNLVIVESPAKAKTIEGYLGKDYLVKSSFGHIRDLPKKGLNVDIANKFAPTYEVPADKKAVVNELKKLSKDAEVVWLASDEDREGEAISWHLFEALKLDEKKTRRIVFHEITKPAILKAIENPRKIDINLVNAQQARRILDRLVGFELSPILWKKVKPNLSAGRVQSVAVRLIVEREREIINFKAESFYRVVALFEINKDGKKSQLKAELPKKYKTKEEAQKFLEACSSSEFTVEDLEKKPSKKSPSAPFTTSTLQQEASRKLGFSVSRTMTVAQKLYESGKITYMRTDSVNLSETALQAAEQEITRSYGKEYVNIKQYKSTSKGAQEAHEAIRPTYMENHEAGADASEQRLYDLIWKRTLASQMANAELEKTTVTIGVSNSPEKLVARGEVIKFDGFLKVYMESTDEEPEDSEEGMLPPMEKGQKLDLNEITATQRFTQHPPRYTEASLVKKLEEQGIGRPSTYAPTISTIQNRGYVVKEEREGTPRAYAQLVLKNKKIIEKQLSENTGAEKSKLFPSDIGMVVNDFLVANFANVLDFGFTAEVEKEFDEIAEGKLEWSKMINDFYKPFHKNTVDTTENSERASGERLLGVDPASGKNVYVRIGRFGPMAQIGEAAEEGGEKPRFSSLKKEQRLEAVTLEDALELFKLPRTVGEFEGKEMIVSAGRFGPYIKHDNKFISLPKTEDPLTITGETAAELIQAKRKADSEKLIKSFAENPEVQVLNGRWGPYIVVGKKNVKIPKGKEAASLTLEECLKLAAEAPDKPARGRFTKKKS